MLRSQIPIVFVCWFLMFAAGSRAVGQSADFGASVARDAAAWDLNPCPMARIPAGTAFLEDPPEGWTHIVLFVESRLASGDVEVVSNSVQHYCQLLKPVILARVARNATGSYLLDTVAIGFTTMIDGRHTVVTTETCRQLGAHLGWIGSRILSGNEAMLKEFTQTARSPANMVIDTPVIMLHDDHHVEMTLRLVVWAAPATGEVGTAAWLLGDSPGEADMLAVMEETFQFLPPNLREERVLNVKKNRISFGIPASDAFAMVRIPQGTPFRFTPSLRSHAGWRRYDAQTYRALWAALAESLQQPPALDAE